MNISMFEKNGFPRNILISAHIFNQVEIQTLKFLQTFIMIGDGTTLYW